MKVVFYITQYEKVKDATELYLKILNNALGGGNEGVTMVRNIKETKSYDIVVTFNVVDFFKIKMRRPFAKIVNWFQGVVPEESYLKNRSKKKYYIFTVLEYLTLNFSFFNFFVSNEMQKHFKNKYNFNKNNFYVMPCFNSFLQDKKDFYRLKKYDVPSFVYIGSMTKWQCVDITILIFKEIKKRLPKATLTLLTNDRDIAIELCQEYDITAEVRYVPLEIIDEELINYKYGFLIRDDIVVNNVATPTKLNTYMANGVIPIYSKVIKDFSFLKRTKYSIGLDDLNVKSIAEEIISFEKKYIDDIELYSDYKNIFNEYYNTIKYEKDISKIFSRYV